MKKRIVIPLLTVLVLLGAGGGTAGYLYMQGPRVQTMGISLSGQIVEKVHSQYEAGYEKYKGVYLPGTTINGEDVSGLSPETYLAQTVAAYRQGEFTLTGRNKAKDTFQMTDVIADVTLETPPEDFLSEEELRRWPESSHETRAYEDPVTVTYDPDKISKAVKASSFVKGEGITDPQDAYFTKTEEGFVIVPETEGTRIKVKRTIDLVTKAINAGKLSLNLEKKNCYRTAAVKSDDPTLVSLLEQGQKIQATVVNMDMTEATETFDWSVFGPWVDWNGTEFTLDEAALKAYVEELSKKYWTYQTQRDFVTHDGKAIKVGGGASDTYGFWLNVDNTTQRLINTLTTWESQDIAASWRTNAMTRNKTNGDIGSTYIEVSLKEQHLWLYKGGSMVFDTDVVTGTASDPNRATPTGVFCILNMLRDHTMRGSYGSEFCHYFMAFTWTGCAIHDAPWRSNFGGTIYLNSGSHGCVNSPPAKAEELFGLVYTGLPVIVY